MLNSSSKANSSLLERCNKTLHKTSLAGDMEQPPKPPKIGADKDGQSIVEANRSTPDLGIGKAYF
jgi:hypothetical protein